MRSLEGEQERSKILGKWHLIRIGVPFLRGKIVMSHSLLAFQRGRLSHYIAICFYWEELERHYLAIFFYWRSWVDILGIHMGPCSAKVFGMEKESFLQPMTVNDFQAWLVPPTAP